MYNDGPATPPCPQPWRLKLFKYAMFSYSAEEDAARAGVHPGQGGGPEGGKTIFLPGRGEVPLAKARKA